jgi:hypothetical protein
MRPRSVVVALFVIGLFSVWGAPAIIAQVPAFEEIVGHDFGERITRHHQMITYLRRLAEASPRVRLVEQGESWEGGSYSWRS